MNQFSSNQALQMSGVEKLRRKLKALGLRTLSSSGLAGIVGSAYGGLGTILMFHEFTHSPKNNLDQGCKISDFEAILHWIKNSGREIVPLEEGLRRLEDPEARPFVVLTFDDGYRCNLQLALPVMEKYEAPATIFVPTEMLTRTINAWWLGLRELVKVHDVIDMQPMGARFECKDLPGKIATLRRLTAWVWEDFTRTDALASVFVGHGFSLADVVEQLVMDEAQMVEADRHPLIEIGAHTTTHRALSLLSAEDVERDIRDNKDYLENRLQREVRYFAYPYGAPSLSGSREAEIVEKIGFSGAVTTEPGCLFADHLDATFLLPRQNAEFPDDSFAQTVCGVNGFFRALASRGGSPVANVEAA